YLLLSRDFVASPNHSTLDRPAGGRGTFDHGGDLIEEVARPVAVGGGDGYGFAEPQGVEFGGEVGVARLVDLVGDHDGRHRGAPEDVRELGVPGAKAR